MARLVAIGSLRSRAAHCRSLPLLAGAPDGAMTSARGRVAGVVALIVTVAFVSAAGGFVLGRSSGRPPAEDSIDVGFLRDMSDHHDQAVQLAFLELANGEEPVLKGFGTDVIASQRYEIGLMEARLRDWGYGR